MPAQGHAQIDRLSASSSWAAGRDADRLLSGAAAAGRARRPQQSRALSALTTHCTRDGRVHCHCHSGAGVRKWPVVRLPLEGRALASPVVEPSSIDIQTVSLRLASTERVVKPDAPPVRCCHSGDHSFRSAGVAPVSRKQSFWLGAEGRFSLTSRAAGALIERRPGRLRPTDPSSLRHRLSR